MAKGSTRGREEEEDKEKEKGTVSEDSIEALFDEDEDEELGVKEESDDDKGWE